jgi:hypothetical protein
MAGRTRLSPSCSCLTGRHLLCYVRGLIEEVGSLNIAILHQVRDPIGKLLVENLQDDPNDLPIYPDLPWRSMSKQCLLSPSLHVDIGPLLLCAGSTGRTHSAMAGISMVSLVGSLWIQHFLSLELKTGATNPGLPPIRRTKSAPSTPAMHIQEVVRPGYKNINIHIRKSSTYLRYVPVASDAKNSSVQRASDPRLL